MADFEPAGSIEDFVEAGQEPAKPPEAGTTPPPEAGTTPPPEAGTTPPPEAGTTPPPEAGTTPPSTFNLADLGDYKSIDEAKQALGSLSRIGELETELNTAKGRVDELSKSNLEDPTLFRLNEAKKSNPEQFETYKSLVFGNPAPIDVLKLDFISRHPEYKDRQEDVELRIKNKYANYLGDEADSESDDFRLAKMDLEVDAKAARENLLAPLNEIEVPTVKTEEEIAADKLTAENTQREFVESWKVPFKSLSDSLSKLDINLQGENDKEARGFMDFEMPEKAQEHYSREAATFIEQQALVPNEANIKAATDFARDLFLIENRGLIFSAIATKARELSDEDWRNKVYHNIKSPSGSTIPPEGGTLSKADAEQKRLLDEAN